MIELPPVLVARTAIQNDYGRLLLLQRSHQDNHNPGLWEFPGGKVDSLEEEHQARELLEETGLSVEALSDPMLIEKRPIMDGKYAGRDYMMYCRLGRMVAGELKLSDEHIDAMLVRRDYNLQTAGWATPQTRLAAVKLAKLI